MLTSLTLIKRWYLTRTTENTTIKLVFFLVIKNECRILENYLPMTRRIIFILFLSLTFILSGTIAAQTAQQIAFVNSNELLDAMPEKVKASEKLNDLNNKYKAELMTMQNDYNKKYSDFISYQNSMGDNIRLRRMQELYELEKNINSFMKVAQDDIDTQEKELLIPLRQKLKDTIYQVGVEQGYICVYDLANPSIIFVTPDAVDITPLVKQKLGIKK